MVKLIGAFCILLGCGGFGFCMAATHKKEEKTLRELIRVIDYISCELQFKMTPLPQVLEQASAACNGIMQKVFRMISKELECRTYSGADMCVKSALDKCTELPQHTGKLLRRWGSTLGKFDLEGQIKELEVLRVECSARLNELCENRDVRLRTYQTLGLCAGASLAILFL